MGAFGATGAVLLVTRSAWCRAATSGCARTRAWSMFAQKRSLMTLPGSSSTPRAACRNEGGSSRRGVGASRAGLEKNGAEIRARGAGGRQHGVHGGAQVPVGGPLEQLADVDDEGAGHRLCFDPCVVPLDLEAA